MLTGEYGKHNGSQTPPETPLFARALLLARLLVHVEVDERSRYRVPGTTDPRRDRILLLYGVHNVLLHTLPTTVVWALLQAFLSACSF